MSKPKRKTQHALRQAEKADVRLGKKLAQFRDNSIVRCISTAGKIADQPPLFALSIGTAALGVATHRPGWVRTGMRMAAAEATATFAKGIIKHYVNRHRPNVAGGDHRMKGGRVVDEAPNNSFPWGTARVRLPWHAHWRGIIRLRRLQPMSRRASRCWARCLPPSTFPPMSPSGVR